VAVQTSRINCVKSSSVIAKHCTIFDKTQVLYTTRKIMTQEI
jgi:hypothetical protein